jgi:hypothetical protein
MEIKATDVCTARGLLLFYHPYLSPQMSLDVSHEWINRCEQVITTKGDDLE